MAIPRCLSLAGSSLSLLRAGLRCCACWRSPRRPVRPRAISQVGGLRTPPWFSEVMADSTRKVLCGRLPVGNMPAALLYCHMEWCDALGKLLLRPYGDFFSFVPLLISALTFLGRSPEGSMKYERRVGGHQCHCIIAEMNDGTWRLSVSLG